jgi:flagellar protein FliO/FliZ
MISVATWAAVVIALGLIAWMLRRVAPLGRSSRTIAVETAMSLGERRSLVVVAVDGRRLLLGLAPGHISLVTELGPSFAAAVDSSLSTPDPKAAS